MERHILVISFSLVPVHSMCICRSTDVWRDIYISYKFLPLKSNSSYATYSHAKLFYPKNEDEMHKNMRERERERERELLTRITPLMPTLSIEKLITFSF